MPETRALAPREQVQQLAAEPIEGLEALSAKCAALAKVANVLSPVASIDYVLPLHKISLRVATISPNVDEQEVYKPHWCKHDERALTKIGLNKLLATAGVNLVDIRRLDDRADPFYCESEVTLSVRGYDGMLRTFCATKSLDLRDGMPETKKGGGEDLSVSALNDRRRHLVSLCETKAGLRALRGLLNLKQKYTVKELAKPFVVPVLVPDLDPNDPETKRALLATALGQTVKLYGDTGGSKHLEATKHAIETIVARETNPRAISGDTKGTGSESEPFAPEKPAPQMAPIDQADFPELPAEVPGPSPHGAVLVCECPCGDQSQLSEAVHKLTTERLGAARCALCFPGKSFDYESHANLATLGIPNRPTLTPKQAQELAADAIKKAAAK